MRWVLSHGYLAGWPAVGINKLKAEATHLWVSCQLGAREHYAIPRALHASGRLSRLITDAWVPPGHPLRLLRLNRLNQRYHRALGPATVQAWTWQTLLIELTRWRKLASWQRTLAQNEWFSSQAATALRRLKGSNPQSTVVFSYSYTALRLFEAAKAEGCITVLGQTNCGPAEERLIQNLARYHPDQRTLRPPAPDHYWENWRRELSLADRVVVNSGWAKENLLREDVPESKITVIPLAYDPPIAAQSFVRQYPMRFTHERPMRVLFLGQINLRKGVWALLEAARDLSSSPIEFVLVGPESICIPQEFRRMPQVKWRGAVTRSEVDQFYRDADVFIFPTHSDGYGLTQLEAQAWKLPIIASSFCGEVVTSGQNGIVLPEVSGSAISQALLNCCNSPQLLAAFAANTVSMSNFSINRLGERLHDLMAGGAYS